jgi:hypothetical protein
MKLYIYLASESILSDEKSKGENKNIICLGNLDR